jgi:hypothetical protein
MYLLRGYPRLLITTDDLPRLRGIALDQARHDRQFARTGGDALALTELTTATTRVLDHEPPDLAALLRLALARDDLAARNDNIPTDLPAAWAILGQHDRAIALATGITDPFSRAQVMTSLVGALAGAGEHDRAQALAELATTTARDITDPSSRARALASVVGALVGVDQPRPLWMDGAIRLLAEVAATSAWVVGVNLIARCAPQELQSMVDDAFGT